MPSSRLFIAINLTKHVQETLTELQSTIRKKLKTNIFRWLKQDNRHITLHFLGNIPSGKIGELKKILDTVASQYNQFNIYIENIGFFPHTKNPRVFWAGITDEMKKVQHIQASLKDILVAKQYNVDSRPYVPHLTLAYIKKSVDYKAVQQGIKIIESLNIENLGHFLVDSIDIMESQLNPEGAQHTRIHTAYLQ